MIEIVSGNEELGYVAFTFKEYSQNIDEISLVLNVAFTLLALAKNSEEKGHGH